MVQVCTLIFTANYKIVNDNQKLLDYFRSTVSLNEENARRILANFQFYHEDVNKRIGSLSGGEKMRIKLAEFFTRKN